MHCIVLPDAPGPIRSGSTGIYCPSPAKSLLRTLGGLSPGNVGKLLRPSPTKQQHLNPCRRHCASYLGLAKLCFWFGYVPTLHTVSALSPWVSTLQARCINASDTRLGSAYILCRICIRKERGWLRTPSGKKGQCCPGDCRCSLARFCPVRHMVALSFGSWLNVHAGQVHGQARHLGRMSVRTATVMTAGSSRAPEADCHVS